ncbi:MAG: hypothetical protein R2681_18460 [Pyrinomonadaceae bacterium]
MIFKTVISTFISLCLLAAVYLNGATAEHKPSKRKDVQEVVIFDDDYKTDKNGNLLLDDGDFPSEILTVATESGETAEVIRGGSSMTQIMTDGFGNKTIMRFFYDHPLVAGIVSRVSASGAETIHVFGKNGLAKLLPASFKDSVMSVTGDELARQAQIYSSAPIKYFNPFTIERPSINDELDPNLNPDFYGGEYAMSGESPLQTPESGSVQTSPAANNGLIQKTASQMPTGPQAVSETKKPAPMSVQAVADDFKSRQQYLEQTTRTPEQTAKNNVDK